jgi:hypothetical protein
MITTPGMNALLDSYFGSGWYIGLIDSSPTLSADDTMASHAGWTEFTDYAEATRQEWTTDAAASGEVSNSVSVDFSINAAGTIAGYFIVNDDTKDGSSGTLFETVLFSSEESVQNGDTKTITHTLLLGQVS